MITDNAVSRNYNSSSDNNPGGDNNIDNSDIIRVSGVSKSYGTRIILDNVNLNVKKGEILGIIGSSGSGKTTLLNIIIGFINPEEGSVNIRVSENNYFVGHDRFLDVHKSKSIISHYYGFAAQVPSFYEDLTVRENIDYFGSLYGLPKSVLRTNTEILLHLMDLFPAKNILGKNLSGGMERRLDIACSLVHDPEILILDEPTADLDPVLRKQIYDLIKKINNKNTTIILASHHLTELEQVCDRIAILDHGRIVACGSPEEIKEEFGGLEEVKVRVLPPDSIYEFSEAVKTHNSSFKSFRIDAGEAVFLTNNSRSLIKSIISVSEEKNLSINYLLVAKPSLDDLFIRISKGD